MRKTKRLKALDVERATEPGMYFDGANLLLRVAPGGSKQWVLRFRLHGRRRHLGLGGFPAVSLLQARKRAELMRDEIFLGKDPVAVRQEARLAAKVEKAKAITVKEACERYIAAKRSEWSSEVHATQWASSLRDHVYPLIGSLPVSSVDTATVMSVLTPIWTTIPQTASRVRNRLEKVLGWATTSRYREGSNPAAWRAHLENLLPAPAKLAKQQHFVALDYKKLPEFMTQLRGIEGMPARALEFAILCASRTGEVLGADWSEIDLQARTWTISAERMKAGREHKIPLGTAALAVLEALPGPRTGLVFGKLRPGSMLDLIRRKIGSTASVHGFRSAFSDWAHETTSYPAELIELSLAHRVGNKVAEAYRRGPMLVKRTQLMAAWADHCAGKPGATVHVLHASTG
jgi:integrase